MISNIIERIPIDRIVCRKQVRETFGEEELAGLAQSIKENGVVQALIAHREGTDIILQDGERRLRAAKLAGLATVPVVIIDRELGLAESIPLQLIANCQRVALSPMERARAIDRLMQTTQWTASQVALKLGMSPGSISKLLALLVLPIDVQQQVESRRLAPDTAYHIAKVPDAGERARLIDEAANGKLTRDRAAAASKSVVRAKPRRARKQRRNRIAFRLGDDHSLALYGPVLQLDTLVVLMEDLIGRLKAVGAAGVPLAEVVNALWEAVKKEA